jgi:hypothetical protein
MNETIEKLATDFATSVVAALRGASLSDLMDLPAVGKPAKRLSKAQTRAWPKCPVCRKNAWPWGKGYCFDHAKASGRKAAQAKVAKTKAARRANRKAAKKK